MIAVSLSQSLWSQNSGTEDNILTVGEPFTLNAYDIRHAAFLIRNEGFLVYWDGGEETETITVKNLDIVFSHFDEEAFIGYQLRYDIVLNGEPLNWEHSYIDYDGEMLNLRLLFTYRNQHPPEDLVFRLPE